MFETAGNLDVCCFCVGETQMLNYCLSSHCAVTVCDAAESFDWDPFT